MAKLTEVVHVRLLLEQTFATLLTEPDEVGSDGLLEDQDCRIVTVLETSRLSLPDYSACCTAGGLELKLLDAVAIE